jgi:hypothetical protein
MLLTGEVPLYSGCSLGETLGRLAIAAPRTPPSAPPRVDLLSSSHTFAHPHNFMTISFGTPLWCARAVPRSKVDRFVLQTLQVNLRMGYKLQG